jgi:hypothetical protein
MIYRVLKGFLMKNYPKIRNIGNIGNIGNSLNG